MDREAWHTTVHGVAKSRTWLSDWNELKPLRKPLRKALALRTCGTYFCLCSVQSLSCVWLFGIPCTAASLSITNSRGLLRLMSIESVMSSNHLIHGHPLLLCLQSFPASGSSQMNQFFPSGGQGIGASASASVLPLYIQDWFPLGWIGWISLQSKGLSKLFSNTTVQKHQFFSAQDSVWSNSHVRTRLLEKPKLWLYETLSSK